MRVFYAGDIHGRVGAVEAVARAAKLAGCEAVVQCGDFGVYWRGLEEPCPIAAWFATNKPDIPWFFCDGNHDNHDVLRHRAFAVNEIAPELHHVARGLTIPLGSMKTPHLFCGGAQSTDRGEGWDDWAWDPHTDRRWRVWWKREVPNREEMNRFVAALANDPACVVAHTAPRRATSKLFPWTDRPDPVGADFEAAMRVVDPGPLNWFFGHWHKRVGVKIGGSSYICTGLHGQGVVWDWAKNEAVSGEY